MAASSSAEHLAPVVSRNSVKVIAESVGIAHLKDEVADALAPDVEYRLRDLVQEALKFAKHGRRETLTTADINYALRLRNCEPLYGFASPDAPRFCRALTPGVFYLEDPELNLADLLAEPLPPMPIEPSFTTHWLAINGVQPEIPQNPNADDVAAAAGKGVGKKRLRDDDGTNGAGSSGEAGSASGVTPLAKHSLSAEEQQWLDKVTSAVQGHTANDEGIIEADKQKVGTRPSPPPPPLPPSLPPRLPLSLSLSLPLSFSLSLSLFLSFSLSLFLSFSLSLFPSLPPNPLPPPSLSLCVMPEECALGPRERGGDRACACR